jgi:hypothetical protein
MAHELIGLDDKREGLGQADGNGDVDSRTARRDVSDRTVDAAATAKRDRAEEFEPGLRFCLPQRSGWHRDNLIQLIESWLIAVSFL